MSWNRDALARHDRPLFIAKENPSITEKVTSTNLDVALATRDQLALFKHVDCCTEGSIWPICKSPYTSNYDALNLKSINWFCSWQLSC